MGLLSILKRMKRTEREARILMLGLDNAGKTTILKTLSEEEIKNIQPTQGFNIKSLVHEGFKLNVWDIGGQKSIRPYWNNYFESTDALVFVIDSSDAHRVAEARLELEQLLVEDRLVSVPMLIFANKQDLTMALEPPALMEALALGDRLAARTWNIQACSATENHGLQDGLEWLISKIGCPAEEAAAAA
eukprot:NODE_3703_length_753_cov_23.902579.p1 GENE.NODE_3703_length_753_cov_23.902579~~NODE_3703_length_753_cov_23.902579.p1  ORF type:complete len:189 (-),score=49.98 NODE_3703_length_753_cov_23.902579:90-656(-)